MKKQLLYFLSLSVIATATSCMGGSKEEKPKEEEKPKNPLEALAKMGQAMSGQAEAQNDALKKRRERGDTLAMPYADLQKYLPEIDGYKRGEPSGASVTMMNTSYSTADASYKNDNGGKIKVTIIDYNQAFGLYNTAAMVWTMGMTVDTPEETAKGFKLAGDIAGLETFKKKSKKATVVLGVGQRFWVSVEANDQENTDFVKSVAQQVDLEKLASL